MSITFQWTRASESVPRIIPNRYEYLEISFRIVNDLIAKTILWITSEHVINHDNGNKRNDSDLKAHKKLRYVSFRFSYEHDFQYFSIVSGSKRKLCHLFEFLENPFIKEYFDLSYIEDYRLCKHSLILKIQNLLRAMKTKSKSRLHLIPLWSLNAYSTF